jgi:hypothetical protein
MNTHRPNKSDIKQIESLVKLGCNESDICLVLNITSDILSKWRAKNKVIEDILKPKARPEFTISHPDFAHMIEEAFTCGGRRFYRFKEEYRMATGRYKYYYATLREIDLRLSYDTLKKFIEAMKAVLNGGGKKAIVNQGDLWVPLINLESRLKLDFDPASVRKLASIAYFDETEDVTSYDEKYGQEKIKLWQEHNVHDFFLTRCIAELLSVNSISISTLDQHLKKMDEIVTESDLNLQKVLEDNL